MSDAHKTTPARYRESAPTTPPILAWCMMDPQGRLIVHPHSSERAYMGILCTDMLAMSLGVTGMGDHEWLRPFIPSGSYVLSPSHDGIRGSDLRAWLSVGQGSLIIDGEACDAFGLALNTAIAIGNDTMKLMAKLHGQCEIHCYVEGEHRRWLAGVMRSGRQANLLRPKQGWEGVIEMLEAREDEPVVCSYSVCDTFPNFGSLPADHPLRQSTDDGRFDDFYEIDDPWAVCLPALRADRGLEISPDRLGAPFGHRKSGFDVRAAA